MTMIAAAATQNHLFHASDRLITISRPKSTSVAHDLASNKSLIIGGADFGLPPGHLGQHIAHSCGYCGEDHGLRFSRFFGLREGA